MLLLRVARFLILFNNLEYFNVFMACMIYNCFLVEKNLRMASVLEKTETQCQAFQSSGISAGAVSTCSQ